MIRRLITFITILFISCSVVNLYAKPKQDTSIKVDTIQKLALYAEPSDKSKVIGHVDIRHHLVPIYHQNGWMKMGDTKDGTVGWVNIEQYQKLMGELRRSWIKSVVITVTEQPDEQGKIKIIAYKNGKQLDEKEAKKILKHIDKQQKYMENHFIRLEKERDRLFSAIRGLWGLDDSDDWIMPDIYRMMQFPILPPIIIMPSFNQD